MHKPTAGTLLTGFFMVFVAMAFPVGTLVALAWAGWKIYRYYVPAPGRDVRRSIRERQARQGQRYTFAVQDETHRMTEAQIVELEDLITKVRASARRADAARARRVPRDRP